MLVGNDAAQKEPEFEIAARNCGRHMGATYFELSDYSHENVVNIFESAARAVARDQVKSSIIFKIFAFIHGAPVFNGIIAI